MVERFYYESGEDRDNNPCYFVYDRPISSSVELAVCTERFEAERIVMALNFTYDMKQFKYSVPK